MPGKLAIKRLTASDLTFFAWHFRNRNAGNQKAVNLNADVFVDRLYPAIEAVARQSENKLGLDLWIAGPDAAPPLNLQRKIIKGSAYKNWRLDGELVHNPDDDSERFNPLRPGDLALLSFEGDLAPNTLTLLLLAKSAAGDQPLLDRLQEHLGDRSMRTLEEAVLREACRGLPTEHPAWLLLTDDDIEEAALGQAPAVTRLLRRPRPRSLSLEELQKARRAAEEIGQLGESLVNHHLHRRRASGEIDDYEWTSEVNAISPYDFRVRRAGGWEKLEVKTTARDFAREYYLPLSELREAAHGEESYRIARVYETTQEHAKVRISGPFRPFAETILGAFEGLPAGVTPNGVTIAPDEQMFDEEIVVVGHAGDGE